jgi:hypothetical protein
MTVGGYHPIWNAQLMISFLVKVFCVYLFTSTHLSFLPYCQVSHQQEQEKVISSSIMSPTHERTYIMVKVRPLSRFTVD